jgi:hypothetical protein
LLIDTFRLYVHIMSTNNVLPVDSAELRMAGWPVITKCCLLPGCRSNGCGIRRCTPSILPQIRRTCWLERERETRRAGSGSSGHELEESGGRRLAGAHTCGPASEDRGGPAARASPSDPTASPPPAGNYSQWHGPAHGWNGPPSGKATPLQGLKDRYGVKNLDDEIKHYSRLSLNY